MKEIYRDIAKPSNSHLPYGERSASPLSCEWVARFCNITLQIYNSPDVALPTLLSLTRSKKFPDETVTQFPSRLERQYGKAKQQLPAQEREPMTISLFATGLLDFRIAEHVERIRTWAIRIWAIRTWANSHLSEFALERKIERLHIRESIV